MKTTNYLVIWTPWNDEPCTVNRMKVIDAVGISGGQYAGANHLTTARDYLDKNRDKYLREHGDGVVEIFAQNPKNRAFL